MNVHDPLDRFERLTPRLREDRPPPVNVVRQVMRRIQAAEAASDRMLALFAACSCLAAAALLVAYTLWPDLSDPLGAFFQIVPPIEL